MGSILKVIELVEDSNSFTKLLGQSKIVGKNIWIHKCLTQQVKFPPTPSQIKTCTLTSWVYICYQAAYLGKLQANAHLVFFSGRNLRRAMLEAAAAVNVPDAIDWALRGFDSLMRYGTR